MASDATDDAEERTLAPTSSVISLADSQKTQKPLETSNTKPDDLTAWKRLKRVLNAFCL